ncbi:hypothetical protein Bhyg_16713, partial [Pseudolycoriella hygida]
MFPPITPIINVDMIYQLQPNPTTEIDDIDLTTSTQPDTNFDDKIKFATWNVRGAIEMDKRNAIDKCLNEKMIQIACIQETRIQMTQLETANYRWHFITRKSDHPVHYGTAILVRHNFKAAVTNFEAVTGNILSCFVRSKELTILLISAHLTDDIGTEIEFDRLKNFLKLYESLPTIILGDFNAQLGKLDTVNDDLVFMGRFLYHDKCNTNGRLLKDLASEAKLFIKNTFRAQKIYKWKFILTTCRLKEKTSSSKAVEAQIDHVLTSRDGTVFVKMLRGYYRNNIKTDHKMIVADVEIRNCEREANENVIDLSGEDDVSCKHQDAEAVLSKEVTDIHDSAQTSLRGKEKVLQSGVSQANDDSLNSDKTRNVIEIDSVGTSESLKMQICPGEPVPPGFEDVVKPVAELQVILSKYRTSPMIGLEYVVELIMGEKRPRTYHCALCDKISDTKDIIDHIKSYEHRCKYLEKHFLTVMQSLSPYRNQPRSKSVLSGVIEAVCDSIEDAYGRMVPNVFENRDYTTNRALYMKQLARERHFDEKSGSTFVSVVDHKAIQSAFETLNESNKTPTKPSKTVTKRNFVETSTRSKRNSLDSISSNDSISSPSKRKIRLNKDAEPVVVEEINLDLISSDSDDGSRANKRKKFNSIRPPTYAENVRENEVTEKFKYERYKQLTEQAVRNLTDDLQEYEKYPEKHPMYPSEWKRYWGRRSKELESKGIDPLTFDFSAEWSKYWIRRLRDLYDDEIALKKFEIRKKLKLSPDYYPASSSSLSSYNESSPSYNYKDESRNEYSPMKSQYPVELTKEEEADSEPLTIISVFRLLAALEDLLGATLGKRVLDLLSKAVHLEKVKANLADEVLMNEENSVLLDTVKEKLKGLIIAKIVNSQQINAVRRAIRNVESIVAIIDNKIAVSKKENIKQPILKNFFTTKAKSQDNSDSDEGTPVKQLPEKYDSDEDMFESLSRDSCSYASKKNITKLLEQYESPVKKKVEIKLQLTPEEKMLFKEAQEMDPKFLDANKKLQDSLRKCNGSKFRFAMPQNRKNLDNDVLNDSLCVKKSQIDASVVNLNSSHDEFDELVASSKYGEEDGVFDKTTKSTNELSISKTNSNGDESINTSLTLPSVDNSLFGFSKIGTTLSPDTGARPTDTSIARPADSAKKTKFVYKIPTALKMSDNNIEQKNVDYEQRVQPTSKPESQKDESDKYDVDTVLRELSFENNLPVGANRIRPNSPRKSDSLPRNHSTEEKTESEQNQPRRSASFTSNKVPRPSRLKTGFEDLQNILDRISKSSALKTNS